MVWTGMRLAFLTIIMLGFCSCSREQEAHSPQYLFKYVKDNQYEPFAIPREKWGAGTVVSYDNNGVENIIWLNDECLKLSPRSSAVTLSNTSYSIGADASLELGLAKAISPHVNLAAALENQSVKDIVMTLDQPDEQVVSDGAIKAKIKSLAENGDTCIDEIFLEGVYVIDRTLGLQGFLYEFKNQASSSISLDATILDQINIAPELKASFQGQSSLAANGPRIIGYRLFDYKIAGGGLVEGALESERVDPRSARQAAMNN